MAPKYLERDPVSGKVAEVIATETGPAAEVIVSTTSSGTIDPSLLPASSGTTKSGQVLVDFGFQTGQEGDIATATVSAAWVTATSFIVCGATPVATADHDPDDYAVEGIVGYAENIVVGVSFDIRAKSCGDNGATWGRWYINYVGTP
jgi:hypothetical protein